MAERGSELQQEQAADTQSRRIDSMKEIVGLNEPGDSDDGVDDDDGEEDISGEEADSERGGMQVGSHLSGTSQGICLPPTVTDDARKLPAAPSSLAPPTDATMAPPATKRMRIPARFRNKKPADMPARPLSSYNAFFRDQRKVIMNERAEGVPQTFAGGLFESMAKTIAARWKNISPEELEKYTQIANEDTLRYRAQMEHYNKKFVEDKSIAAKRRRAENRKRKQLEKASVAALESNAKTTKASTSLRHSNDTESISSSQTLPASLLSLNQVGAANYPSSSLRMQPADTSNYNPADLQMRLLAAHAEGLGLAVPPTPSGQVTDYLRQFNSAQVSRTLQQQSTTPSDSRSIHSQSDRAGEAAQTLPRTSMNYGNDSLSSPQDPLSILQLIQQQQNILLPASATTDFESLFALQLQRTGQLQQMQPHLSQLDPSFGLLLQLQQQQQLQHQQLQQHDMARLSAEANFYQQQQQGQDDRSGSNWQQYTGNHKNS